MAGDAVATARSEGCGGDKEDSSANRDGVTPDPKDDAVVVGAGGSADPETPDAAASKPGAAPQPGRIARARGSAEQVERRARESLEQARAGHLAVQLVSEAFEHDRARAGGLLAGGLAYRIFLWEIPLALFLLSALGLAAQLAGDDPAELARQVGLTAALSAAIANGVAASEHGRVWFLLLGAFLTVWAGRGIFRGFRLVTELAWRARAAPYSSLRGSLLVTAFGLGFIVLQSLMPWLSESLGVPGFVHFILGLFLAEAAFTWGLSLLPRADAPWTAVIPGAIALGVGLRLMSLAASTHFASRLEHTSDLYGSLSIAIVLMLYLFLIARLFVAAQFLNATLHRRGAKEQLATWASSAIFSQGEQGGDHHPQADAADDVVGQVRPDVHPAEPDRPDHAPEKRAGPPG